jgi:hypothetical protein
MHLFHCPRVRNGARRNMLFINPALTAGFNNPFCSEKTNKAPYHY